MKTLEAQTFLFGELESISLQEDSPANHIVKPGSDKATQMTATYGRLCLQELNRFSRVGSWAKTFADLLIGAGAWYSTRCNLIWKPANYQVIPFLLPACAVNAPHRRDRIWFVAHTTGGTCINGGRNEGCESPPISEKLFNESFAIANPNINQRREGRLYASESEEAERYTGSCSTRTTGGTWEVFPTQPPICAGDDGLPTKLDGITLSKWREESLKSAGNAIVPQVAFEIFKAIDQMERML